MSAHASTQYGVASAPRRTGWESAEAAVALVAIFMLSTRIFIGSGVSVGHVFALALIPLWLPRLAARRGGLWLAGSALLAAVSGIWLTVISAQNHEWSGSTAIATTMLLLSLPMAAGIIVWGQELLPLWLMCTSYGMGLVAAAAMRPSIFLVNPWKFAIGLPIAVILLAAALRFERRVADMTALALLALVSIAMDSRAFFGVFAIALLVLGWQALPRIGTKKTSAAKVLMAVAAIGLAVYVIGSSLLVEGYLGSEAQARSVEQQERAGSVILGGRPELAATVALFLDRPLGFGSGTIASATDILVAKTGMSKINYDPNNGYVENFMFGRDKFELHSITGDFWAYFGWPGLLFLAVVVVLMVSRLGQELAERRVTGLFLFAVMITGWNLFFNPIYSSAPFLGLAAGLALAGPHRLSKEKIWRRERRNAGSPADRREGRRKA